MKESLWGGASITGCPFNGIQYILIGWLLILDCICRSLFYMPSRPLSCHMTRPTSVSPVKPTLMSAVIIHGTYVTVPWSGFISFIYMGFVWLRITLECLPGACRSGNLIYFINVLKKFSRSRLFQVRFVSLEVYIYTTSYCRQKTY